MTQTTIAFNNINGRPVVGGPAAIIRAARDAGQSITITGKSATGDIVWLVKVGDEARTIQHPQYGEIVYAYVDPYRLDAAPQVAELERQREQRNRVAAMQAEERGRAMVPACGNCGDCARCV